MISYRDRIKNLLLSFQSASFPKSVIRGITLRELTMLLKSSYLICFDFLSVIQLVFEANTWRLILADSTMTFPPYLVQLLLAIMPQDSDLLTKVNTTSTQFFPTPITVKTIVLLTAKLQDIYFNLLLCSWAGQVGSYLVLLKCCCC